MRDPFEDQADKMERLIRWGIVAAIITIIIVSVGCAGEAMRAMQDAGMDIGEAQESLRALDDKSQALATGLAADAATLRSVAPDIEDAEARETVEGVANNLDGHITSVGELREDGQAAFVSLAQAKANNDDAQAFTAPSAMVEEGVNAATGGLWYWILGGTGVAGAVGAFAKRRARNRRERRAGNRYAEPMDDSANGPGSGSNSSGSGGDAVQDSGENDGNSDASEPADGSADA